jgi:hypothetical protein
MAEGLNLGTCLWPFSESIREHEALSVEFEAHACEVAS